jgi:hypothetical protein
MTFSFLGSDATEGFTSCCGKPVGCSSRTCRLGQHPWKRDVYDHDPQVRCQAVGYGPDPVTGIVRGGADTQRQCRLPAGHAGIHDAIPTPRISGKLLA